MFDPKQSFFSEQVRKKKSYFKEGKYKINTAEFRRQINEKTNTIAKLFTKLPVKAYGIFALALFLLAFYSVFLTDYFVIKQVVLLENGKLSANAGLNQLASRFLGKNLFLVGQTEVVEKFGNFSASLSDLRLNRDFPDKLSIEIAEIPVIANLAVTVDGTAKNYTINRSGLIVGIGTTEPKLPTLNVRASSFPSSKDPYIESDLLTLILETKSYFEQTLKLKVVELNYLLIARELHLKTETGFVVWIDLGYDPKKQINKLRDAESKLGFREQKYEYFDLRITGATSDRIIFKKI